MKRKMYDYLVVFYIAGSFCPSRLIVQRLVPMDNISPENLLKLDKFITEVCKKENPESPDAFVTDYKLLRTFCMDITNKEEIRCLKYNLLKDIKK